MGNYYVKFVRWNVHTISNLINQEIRFSTVYDFNDFNELGYIGDTEIKKDNYELVKSELKKATFLENIRKMVVLQSQKPYIDEIIDLVLENKHDQLLTDKYAALLHEHIAFSNVGIFCLSDTIVFKDDSAQLMFAHYGDNLKGLAFIYEVYEVKEAKKIDYGDGDNEKQDESNNKKCEKKPPICNKSGCLQQWCEGIYEDMDSFTRKSEKWKYEKEHRVFNKPGIALAEAHNIKLMGILYTSRFSGDHKLLTEINERIYDGKLRIKNIEPSFTEYRFKMNQNDFIDIDKWLDGD